MKTHSFLLNRYVAVLKGATTVALRWMKANAIGIGAPTTSRSAALTVKREMVRVAFTWTAVNERP